MQSVQFQNLDRIVRNSTEKEQKKQSDGESFREICWFRDSRFCR